MGNFTRNYNIQLKANPTIPGVETQVTQSFDGTVLADSYVKRVVNALRRHGCLPRFGGQYQLAAMVAQHMGVQMPVGYALRKWENSAHVVGWNWCELDHAPEAFREMMRLSDVRHKMQRAAGVPEPAGYFPEDAESSFDYGRIRLLGWPRSDLIAFRDTLKERALIHIPSYLDDMRKLADVIEARPKFEVGTDKLLTVDSKASGSKLTTKVKK